MEQVIRYVWLAAVVPASDDLRTESSLDAPARPAPVERPITIKAAEFDYTLPPQSLTVLRVAFTRQDL